jgi:hypothetical protein
MAKAQLKFDLDNPEDRKAHMRCVKSLNMTFVLFQISCNLRRECEDRMDHLTKDEVLDFVFERINELFNEHNIDLGELID